MIVEEESVLSSFLSDVSSHEMTILFDEHEHRTINFSNPKCCAFAFRLITWPGFLAITGDMGSSMFARTTDMFCFFRRDKLIINSCYWTEKMVSDSRITPAEEWSREYFEERVTKDYDEHCESFLSNANAQEQRETLWRELQEDVLCESNDEHRALLALYDFDCHGFVGSDIMCDGYDCKVYTFHHLWRLFAIVWGIQQYDARSRV